MIVCTGKQKDASKKKDKRCVRLRESGRGGAELSVLLSVRENKGGRQARTWPSNEQKKRRSEPAGD